MAEFVWQFGERFRTIRKLAKMKQDDFGEQLGVSRQTINAYENNRQRPPLDMMEKVCELRGISPLWLLTGNGDPEADGDYPQAEGLYSPNKVALSSLSPEQKSLINFIANDQALANKLAQLLMQHGLKSLGPDSDLAL